MNYVKNLQVITRHGTKTGPDKIESEPIKCIQKDDLPNCDKQKELFRDAENVFKEISAIEEQYKSNTIKEILHPLYNEKVAQRLVDVFSILKEETNTPKISKDFSYMSSNTQ